MLDFEFGVELMHENGLVLVQEEPALEIALPHGVVQPELTTLQRGKLRDVEALVAKIYRNYVAAPGRGLGPDYQDLVSEFQPLFAWAIASWTTSSRGRAADSSCARTTRDGACGETTAR